MRTTQRAVLWDGHFNEGNGSFYVRSSFASETVAKELRRRGKRSRDE